MAQVIKQNQIHRPRKNPKDKLGNDKNRLWLKSGNATMLLAKDLTRNAIYVLTQRIENFLDKNNTKLDGKWVITK